MQAVPTPELYCSPVQLDLKHAIDRALAPYGMDVVTLQQLEDTGGWLLENLSSEGLEYIFGLVHQLAGSGYWQYRSDLN